MFACVFFFSSRRRHTRCALVTGVQTCALPIWGMRLVLTVPRAVARALQLTDGEAVHVHSVGDFSVAELDALLQQSGRRWADLPPDLKRLLRSPIQIGRASCRDRVCQYV